MKEEAIELNVSHEVEESVEKRVRTVGVRGLDVDAAQRLGVFSRISNLLCAIHASIMAAYSMYGSVDALFSELGARKNEINREMNQFEKAYDRFIRFFTGYFSANKADRDVYYETERLYKQIMRWMQIPEKWELGDKQRSDNAEIDSIHVDLGGDNILSFEKTSIGVEAVENSESWCVLKYNTQDGEQTKECDGMDKASALMVAKRLSSEDTENVYTAALLCNVVEKRTDVIPFKVFKNNETIGKITKTLNK